MHLSSKAVVGALIGAVFAVTAAPALAKDLTVANASSPPSCAKYATYPTIQSAVTASSSGDQIIVCPGVYPERVTVPTGKNNLDIEGVNEFTTEVTYPSTPTLPGTPDALFRIQGARNIEIQHFTISGPWTDTTGCVDALSEHYGVRVDSGGSADIYENHITKIQDANTALRGCQDGVAVQVGRNYENTSGSAQIEYNIIDNYQKNGPTVDGPGSSAVIADNAIIGDTEDPNGINPYSALNGVQVGRDATATVQNNSISFNEYGPATSDQSYTGTGILAFEVNGGSRRSGVQILNNDLFANDIGLALGIGTPDEPTFGPTMNVLVQNNQAPDRNHPTNRFDGFYLLNDTQNNLMLDNQAHGSGEYDCRDDSKGSGTAGTANWWSGDEGVTQMPAGICKPPR